MKKAICVNVDVDTWITAKSKVSNISDYLNECLKSLSGINKEQIRTDEIEEDIIKIKKILEEYTLKLNIKETELKISKEVEQKSIEEQKEIEQYARWLCPVCKHKNFIDYQRCSVCNLPTRNDAKTKIINLKDEGDLNGSTN